MHKLALALLLIASPLASAEVWFESKAGVTVGSVTYQTTEVKHDKALESAIAAAVGATPGQEIRYLYNRVSLTREGRQVLVTLLGQDWSGSGGNTALVMEKSGPTYRLVTRFTLVNPPILVGPGASHGWKDLTWLVAGGGVTAHYATLHFDGKTYPANPSDVPATPIGTVLSGKAYCADTVSSQAGIKFKAR